MNLKKRIAIGIFTVVVLALGILLVVIFGFMDKNDGKVYLEQLDKEQELGKGEEKEEISESAEKVKSNSKQEEREQGKRIAEQLSREELEERIEIACGRSVTNSSYEDYDGDGIRELFAVVMWEQGDSDMFIAEAWFSNGKITSKLNTWKDLYGDITAGSLIAGNKKHYYINMLNAEGICTLIGITYAYENEECFEVYDGLGRWEMKGGEIYYSSIQYWGSDAVGYCVDYKVCYEDRKYYYYASIPISHAVFEEYGNSRQEYEKALNKIRTFKNENTDYSEFPYLVEAEILYNSDDKIFINFEAWKSREAYDSGNVWGSGSLDAELIYAEFDIIDSKVMFNKIYEGNWKEEILDMEPYYSPEALKVQERMEKESMQLSSEQFEQIIQDIRTNYYTYQDLLSKGEIEKKIGNGYKAYYYNGLLRCIEINTEENGIAYNRLYYIMDDKLYFAFLFTNNKPSIENRLYFYNGKLIRWIDSDGAVHDKEYGTAEFKELEEFVKEVDLFIN